jgi:hypothetical protein
MQKKKGIKVEVTRRGFDYALEFESMASVARATGRSPSTVKQRMADGLWLRTDRGIAVKVRAI